jgi:hypothetical protein
MCKRSHVPGHMISNTHPLGGVHCDPGSCQEVQSKFRLLLDAHGAANIDVVHYILDSHDGSANRLPLGTVDLHQRDDSEDTPILAASGSVVYLDKDADEVEDEGRHSNEWIQNRIARSHQLINFLLNRGCSATHVIPPLPHDLSPWGSQIQGSVLGLAVPRGNGPLIQRLIDSCADIYLMHQHFHHARVPLHSRITKGHTDMSRRFTWQVYSTFLMLSNCSWVIKITTRI